jgi:hypothetical protein
VEVSGVFVAAVVLAASRLVPIDAKPASAVCACDFAVEQHCPSVLTIMRLYALSHKTFLVQPHLTSDISAFPMTDDRFSKVQHHLQLLPHGNHHAHSRRVEQKIMPLFVCLVVTDVIKERNIRALISFLNIFYK